MHLSERRLFTQMSRFLGLGFLMLFATAVLRYNRLECAYARLGEEAGDPRSRYCQDRLYQSVSLALPPGGPLNCSRIVRGDPEAVEEALLSRLRRENKRKPLTEEDYLNMTKDCAAFKEGRRFLQVPLSREEEDFPIAYSMVIHEKVEMFERLLRAIYAPQNVYCVHVDKKSPGAFQEAVRAVASCFENVFLPSRQEEVVYASWARVRADLNCMEDLLRSGVPWRYLLNTCGTDFPIKTNAEIVRSLKLLNGQNNMESERPSAGKQGRWKYHHEVKEAVVRTDKEKAPPPHSSPMFTGNAYIVVTREFVQHLFVDPTVKRLLEWSEDTYSPDEHLWATLHRMPGVPGSVPYNAKFDLTDMNAIARLVKWSYMSGDVGKGAPYPHCTGASQRAVCVYGAGDLRWILAQRHLFANKFDPQVDDGAIRCLEEHLRHKAVYGTGL